MKLRLRRLELRVITSSGPFGTSIIFGDGLTIVYAPNSSGKSSCLQAVIYALGLECVFGPSRDVPLPPAMTDRIEHEDGFSSVLESEVVIEIENERQEFLTVLRTVKGARSRELVTVWNGRALTEPDRAGTPEDLFVRRPGSAQSEFGFHSRLRSFVGWTLPNVPSFSASEVMLYMEVVFPLMFVEQKKGWAAIEGKFPTHLRIREPQVRAVEFLLGLESPAIADRRLALKGRADQLRGEWQSQLRQLESAARSAAGRVDGIPAIPTGAWPPRVAPVVRIARGPDWKVVGDLIEELRARLSSLQSQPILTVNDAAPELQSRLTAKEQLVRDLDTRATTLYNNLALEAAELRDIEQQLAATEVEIARSADIRTLQNLGSVRALQSASGHCPTCNQTMENLLLEESVETVAMDLEQTIGHLREQKDVYRFMRERVEASIRTLEAELAATRSEIASVRAEIRSLKSSLVSDSRIPSLADVRDRVELESDLSLLSRLNETTAELIDGFTPIAEEWTALQSELASLDDSDSESDTAKLRLFERSFREQLRSYGVTSVSPDEISLNGDTLRPTMGDYDLQFDLSASDTIRASWAYRTALLEVARIHATNHLGLLVVDEPRQQETAIDDFGQFLRRLSAAGRHGEQVIVATSSSLADLHRLMPKQDASFVVFDGRVLRRLPV